MDDTTSTWYQVSHGRWYTGEMRPVEVTKETAKMIWCKDLYWKTGRIDRQAKISDDYRYFADRKEAKAYQVKIITKKIGQLKKKIEVLEGLRDGD